MTLTYDDILKELKNHNLLRDVQFVSETTKRFTLEAIDSKAQANSCFILFKAVKRSSKERLRALLEKGVSFFILEEESLLNLLPPTASAVLVSSGRKAWAHLSSFLYNYPQKHLKIIAITGTNGKTSTAWILSQVLMTQGVSAAYIGTLGNSITEQITSPHTTPDPPTLFALLSEAVKKGITHIALEVSSHSLAQKKVDPILFDAAVFTSFSRDHLDYHSSMEEYLSTKLSLFTPQHLKKSAKKYYSTQVLPFLPSEKKEEPSAVFYGAKADNHTSAEVFETLEEDLSGFKISFKQGGSSFTREAPFIGEKNQDNFFVSLLLARDLCGEVPVFSKEEIKPVPARLELIPLSSPRAPLIFIDYAHTPEALRNALIELSKHKKSARLFVLFGCGGDRDSGKRALMGSAAEKNADHVTITSDNPRSEKQSNITAQILSGFDSPEKALVIEDRRQAILETLKLMKECDCLLLAGKGHENYIETNGVKKPFSEKSIILNHYKETQS